LITAARRRSSGGGGGRTKRPTNNDSPGKERRSESEESDLSETVAWSSNKNAVLSTTERDAPARRSDTEMDSLENETANAAAATGVNLSSLEQVVKEFGGSLQPEKFAQSAGGKMSWQLFFHDPEIERNFRIEYAKRFSFPARQFMKQLMPVCCLAYLLIVPWETMAYDHDRVAVISAALIGALFLLASEMFRRVANSPSSTSQRLQMCVVSGIVTLTVGLSLVDTLVAQANDEHRFSLVGLKLWFHAWIVFTTCLTGGLQFQYTTLTVGLIWIVNVSTLSIDDATVRPGETNVAAGTVIVVVIALVGIMLSRDSNRFLRQDFLQEMSVHNEAEVAERIVASLLPSFVSQKLIQSGKALENDSNSLPNVSMLFADIVGFTTISADITPEQVVGLLEELFSLFDSIAAELGVFKVETIGDCYYCASGVTATGDSQKPATDEETVDHALVLAEFAVRMQVGVDEIQGHLNAILGSNTDVFFRVGIHSGPVVAGVVGHKMPRYHLFGENVKMAEMMESKGQAQKINVSEDFMQTCERQNSLRPVGQRHPLVFQQRPEVDKRGRPMYWMTVEQSSPLPTETPDPPT